MTQADEATAATQPGPEPKPQPAPGSPAEPASAPLPGADTAPQADPAPEPPQRESLVDAIADLLQMTVDWLRAEASDIVRDKVVLPVQQLGTTLASAIAAAVLLVLGIGFIAVALLILLARWLTWPGALGAIGAVLVIAAGIFTYLKVRSIQK